MLLLLTLIFGKSLVAESTQNCIWVPKGYFSSCSYRHHHINQVRQFDRILLRCSINPCIDILYDSLFMSDFKILIKKSSSLCYQSGSKTNNNYESYEIQYGCEKRNFKSKTSDQGELKSFCCSKNDVTKIFGYFSQT